MKIYVSTIIESEGKIILVKEAKKQYYEKWNFPSGHVEENEDIINAAIREVKEETNLDVELNGLISIYNNMYEGYNSISFIFSSKLKNVNKITFNQNEILEVKGFSINDIKNMQDELKDKDYIIDSIDKYWNKNIKTLDTLIIR